VPLGCELPQVLPLHRRFPGTAKLGSLTVAQLPTEVQRIDSGLRVAERVGALWVKRDDATASEYGGNKVRKLEFLLARALQEGARSIITFGALGSNHVLATSVHGRALGLDVHAVLTPQARTPYLASNVASDLAVGAVLHPAPSFDAAPRIAVGVRARLRERDGVEPSVIPFGGTCPESDAAYVNAACELAEQVSAGLLPEPDLVYVPLGSAGTSAGLAVGLAAAGLKTRVVAVRVVPEEVANESSLREVVDGGVTLLRELDEVFPALALGDLNLEVRHEFFGYGYAVPTSECSDAVRIAEQAALRLETTYTGKALAALRADAASGRLADKTVLFWNTYNSRPLPATAETLPSELEPYVL
jgi:1-aminocyclopropane-1-carboxylate deaminase/D-cysteine desulfhydrase-like pyridoxal-dependent ACC family enzyme